MADDKKKPDKIRISPKAAKKLRAVGSSLPEGSERASILARILKKLKED